jgi:hypothetical protein
MKKLRIAHYPQVPCKPFCVEVNDIYEAKKVSDTLASYDLFQYRNRIKPDYANMTILQEFDKEEGVWLDWYDEETGIDDINEYIDYLEDGDK